MTVEIKMTTHVKNASLLDYDYNESSVRYNARIKAMGRFSEVGTWGFKYLNYDGGYWNETLQSVITLEVPRDCDDIATIKQELLEMIKYIKVFEEGFAPIDMFEHTCSENGCYRLLYWPKTKEWEIRLERHHIPSTVFKSDDIEKVIFRIVRDYWCR
jgi:hypothetical protein